MKLHMYNKWFDLYKAFVYFDSSRKSIFETDPFFLSQLRKVLYATMLYKYHDGYSFLKLVEYFNGARVSSTMTGMVLILDGNLEHVAHV